jgi:hypothetical protein
MTLFLLGLTLNRARFASKDEIIIVAAAAALTFSINNY